MEEKMNITETPASYSRTVEGQVTIDAPVEAVWKAITEAEELKRWFPVDAKVEPGQGGEMTFYWKDYYVWRFHIKDWEPDKHLRLGYDHDRDFHAEKEDKIISDNPRELVVDYRIEAEGGKTTLRLVHSGFGTGSDWDQEYNGVKRGWTSELLMLKFYLEEHPGEDRVVNWSRKAMNTSVEEIWDKFMSFGGIDPDTLKEGGSYSYDTDTGEHYEGKVISVYSPTDFIATVDNLNNALIRVKIDHPEEPTLDVLLESYGLEEEKADAFKQYWDKILSQKF
ncbi:MAG: SRPBCC domain-containing protein [Bacteroidetes bacterium]|nr:SRPBCC domain-containing protein [Bacteroidota bacterium]